MIGLDTNVLVRAMVGDDPQQSPVAAQLLSAATPGSLFVSRVVLVELYWVLTRAYCTDKTTVLAALRNMTDAAEFVIEQPAQVEAALRRASEGADFADALIDAASRAAGCDGVVSFDRKSQSSLAWSEPEPAR